VRSGWSQWRETQFAIEQLRAQGLRPPAGRLQAACAELGLVGRIAVVATDTPLALCWGLWRPRIWVSAGMVALLSTEEIVAVLRHEREHLHRLHPLQLLIARALAVALPLLPVVRELAVALPQVQELAADRGVIRAGGGHALGRALLALVDAQRQTTSLPLAPGIAGALDARLDQLTGARAAPARLSRRALIATWLTFGAGTLLLWLSTLGMGPAQVIVAARHLGTLRVMDPWRCLVAPAVLGAMALEGLQRRSLPR
jgi:Zn-dependent protease with chaperone function